MVMFIKINTVYSINDKRSKVNMSKGKFSQIIAEAIKSSGMNKMEISRKTGFSRHSIIKWEKGEMSISLENADKLLQVLGVEITIGEKRR